MQITQIVDAWLDNRLPDDFTQLFLMKQEVWRCGREAFEACQITENLSIAELLIMEQQLMADIHESIAKKLSHVPSSSNF